MGKYLPAIDGLRAIAVLSVVAYHAGLPLGAGYVGVDVFFVISGYVITRMLLAEPRIDLAAFYARRVRRILPALVLVVAVTLLLSTLLSADLQIATHHSAVAAMAMSGNLWFQFHTSYFDSAADTQPLLHLWSLGVEEQFYLLWPLLLMVRKPWVLGLLAVGSFVFAQFWIDTPMAFFQMPARFWELAVGGLVALVGHKANADAVDGLGVGDVVNVEHVGQDGLGAAGLSVSPRLVYAKEFRQRLIDRSLKLRARLAARAPLHPRVQLLQPANVDGHSSLARLLGSPILRNTANPDVQRGSQFLAFLGWTGLLVLCFAVSHEPAGFPASGAFLPVFGSALVLYALHGGYRLRLLEWKPVRYVGLVSYSFYLWHWPLLAINRAVSFDPPAAWEGVALCVLAFGLACLSYHFVELPFRRTNAPKVRAIALGVTACVVMAGCAAAYSGTVKPTQGGDFTTIARECYQTHDDTPALPPLSCGTGNVVLWGDSHAHAWLPYAQSFGSVRLLTRAACAPSVGVPIRRNLLPGEERLDAAARNNPTTCGQYDALAVEEAKRGEVVILAARWIGLYQGDDALRGMASALDALSGVPRVIVLGPLPVMPHQPNRCIATGHECSVPRKEFDRLAEPTRKFLRDAVSRHPNAEFVDPTDYFCDAMSCPLLRDGKSLYWDDDHISASAARAFARSSGTQPSVE